MQTVATASGSDRSCLSSSFCPPAPRPVGRRVFGTHTEPAARLLQYGPYAPPFSPRTQQPSSHTLGFPRPSRPQKQNTPSAPSARQDHLRHLAPLPQRRGRRLGDDQRGSKHPRRCCYAWTLGGFLKQGTPCEEGEGKVNRTQPSRRCQHALAMLTEAEIPSRLNSRGAWRRGTGRPHGLWTPAKSERGGQNSSASGAGPEKDRHSTAGWTQGAPSRSARPER
jgi:hypothetical protein